MSAEAMALFRQFIGQRLEVVDFAVERDRYAAVLVEQRLMAAGDIDDGEATMTEADSRREVKAAAVGAAMGNAVGHASEEARIDWAPSRDVHDPRDPAHVAGLARRQRGKGRPERPEMRGEILHRRDGAGGIAGEFPAQRRKGPPP